MRNKMFKNSKIIVTIFMASGLLLGSNVCTVSAAEIISNAETEIYTELGTETEVGLEENLEQDVDTNIDANVDISTDTEIELETEIRTEEDINEKVEWNLDLGLEDLVTIEEKASMEYIEETEESIQEKEVNLKEKIVTIKGTKFVTDTFHGVKTLYRTGGNDGTNATYSCAAFVKRYYSQVYNVNVYNLLAGCTPISSKGTIRKVSSPKEGDIVATTSGSGNHWAIVKNVNNNGTVTLIEQNWKWQQGGKTVARVNRRVKASACKIYRLKK